MSDLYRSALADARSGNFPLAEEKLNQLLSEALPKETETAAFALLGVVELYLGKVDAAVRRLQKAIRRGADNADVHMNLCNAMRLQGKDLNAAIGHGRRAVVLKPDSHDAHLNLGIALEEVGSLDEAAGMFEQALTLRPGSPQAGFNLGNVLAKQGRFDAAAQAYRVAIAAAPAFVEAYHNLGNVLQAAGDRGGAIEAFRQAVGCGRDYPAAQLSLGNALTAHGDPVAALRIFDEMLTERPEFAEAHLGRGNALNSLGDWKGAIAAYRSAVAYRPDFAEAYVNLGNALAKRKDFDRAVTALKTALTLRPRSREVQLSLGNTLKSQGALDEAVVVFDRLLAAYPDFAEAHVNRGNTLEDMGDMEGAVAAYRNAIAVRPNFAEAHVNLGNALEAIGDRDGAIDVYEQALAIRPDLAEVHRLLTYCRQYRDGDPHLERLRELVADSGDDEAAMHLKFALGKAEEDCGNFAEAYDHYAAANALKHRGTAYDRATGEAEHAALLRLDDRLRDKDIRLSAGDLKGIFIVGIPRCGSTLIENVLSLHPDSVDLGECRAMMETAKATGILDAEPGMAALSAFHDRYMAAALAGKSGFQLFTDKMLGNFRYCGLIARTMPTARIVHMVRNPLDNVMSIFRNYFVTGNNFAYDLDNIVDYYHAHMRLMAAWKERYGDRIYTCDYDRLVADPEGGIRNVVSFCGYEWDDGYLAPHLNRRAVRTASVDQVRRPIYATSVQA
jgi:tetratricopeptide (TPR) repeat protein